MSWIYLSGNCPYYLKEDRFQISEALAMSVFITDIKFPEQIPPTKLILDPIARNTRENVDFSTTKIADLKKLIGRPLRVVIVTSPYHLRRTALIWRRFQIDNQGLISDIIRVASESKPSLTRNEWFKSLEGIKAYLIEFWKIHGARITGEI